MNLTEMFEALLAEIGATEIESIEDRIEFVLKNKRCLIRACSIGPEVVTGEDIGIIRLSDFCLSDDEKKEWLNAADAIPTA